MLVHFARKASTESLNVCVLARCFRMVHCFREGYASNGICTCWRASAVERNTIGILRAGVLRLRGCRGTCVCACWRASAVEKTKCMLLHFARKASTESFNVCVLARCFRMARCFREGYTSNGICTCWRAPFARTTHKATRRCVRAGAVLSFMTRKKRASTYKSIGCSTFGNCECTAFTEQARQHV
jgi:hypothetical protein